MKQRGLALAIVSNKAQPAVTALCQQYFSAYIQTAIGESRQVKRKPAPDTVLLALRQLGVQRQQAVYVGDSEVDSQTARNAGLDCFWSAGAFGTGRNWKSCPVPVWWTGRKKSQNWYKNKASLERMPYFLQGEETIVRLENQSSGLGGVFSTAPWSAPVTSAA